MMRLLAVCFDFFKIILLIVSMARAGYAAGFDCARAGTDVEKMICANPELSRLDEQLNASYRSALTSDAKTAIKKQQQIWLHEVNNQCHAPDCLLNAYRQRINELSAFNENSWRLFKDEKLGIEFYYPTQRQIRPSCHDSQACIALIAPTMPDHTEYMIAFEVFDGDLNQVAAEQAIFEPIQQGWVAKGRSGEFPAQVIAGDGWHGIMAVVDCGVSDASGFHGAAGECLWAVLSNGKRSIVIDTEGSVGNDALSRLSIKFLRFNK